MMKILTLIAVFLLTSTAYATNKHDGPLQALVEFEYACKYVEFFYGVSCGNLKPPIIVTSRVVSDDYHGFYIPGEPYIFIHKRLWLHRKPEWRSTVAHETTHYILHNRAFRQFTRCESERAARNVHHSYEGSAYDGSWVRQYRC